MVSIRPWLWVGNKQDFRDVSDNAFAVLSLSGLYPVRGIGKFCLAVDDGIPLADWQIQRGVGFIFQQKLAGRNILVACELGQSRSAAFVVAALHEIEGLSLTDALSVVKERHPDTGIHPMLWNSMLEYYGAR